MISVLPYAVDQICETALSSQSARPTPVMPITATLASAIREKRRAISSRTRLRASGGSDAVAGAATTNRCARPPIQTAAPARCSASTTSASQPRPGSPACPDRPGPTTAQPPATAAATATA